MLSLQTMSTTSVLPVASSQGEGQGEGRPLQGVHKRLLPHAVEGRGREVVRLDEQHPVGRQSGDCSAGLGRYF